MRCGCFDLYGLGNQPPQFVQCWKISWGVRLSVLKQDKTRKVGHWEWGKDTFLQGLEWALETLSSHKSSWKDSHSKRAPERSRGSQKRGEQQRQACMALQTAGGHCEYKELQWEAPEGSTRHLKHPPRISGHLHVCQKVPMAGPTSPCWEGWFPFTSAPAVSTGRPSHRRRT